jgi:RimJ/RimL family protein N-acetyltransferase
MILLETKRLRLRSFTIADADHLHALDNDPAVMRYINGGSETPHAVIRTEILPGFMRYDAGYAFGVWAAELRENGAFAGWFSLRPSTPAAETAVLGYRLTRACWGRGLATEGARALIARGFTITPALQRIIATTYEENHASRRVLAKCGFTLVRRFRLTPADMAQADTFYTDSLDIWDGDDLEYALERQDWVPMEGQHD